jgi:uncharacterized membrane protein
MAHIEQEVSINAPVGAVFQKLMEPETAPEWMASLQDVHNVTGHEVGESYEWSFKMAGRPFHGKTVFMEIEPNQRVREESSGGISSTWDWRLTPTAAGGTELHVAVDYTVPGSILGAIADKLFIERQNEKDLRQSLENLKHMCEEQRGAAREVAGP